MENPYAAPSPSDGAVARPAAGKLSLDADARWLARLTGWGATIVGIYFFAWAGVYTASLAVMLFLTRGEALPVVVFPIVFCLLLFALGSKFAAGGRAFRGLHLSNDDSGRLARAFDEIGHALAIMTATIASVLVLSALIIAAVVFL